MKKIIYFIFIFQFTFCRKQQINIVPIQSKVICANDSILYTNLHNNLIYNDSTGIIYLKIKNDFSLYDDINSLNECQKNPYTYVKELLYKDSVILLEDIVDIKSFKKIDNTINFFKDNNYTYVYQNFPVTYPALKIINIIPNKAKIIRHNYIKDDKNVYFLGEKVSSNAGEFKYIPNKDSLLLFVDEEKIIWNWNEISENDFLNISLSKNVKDSLQKIYFSNK